MTLRAGGERNVTQRSGLDHRRRRNTLQVLIIRDDVVQQASRHSEAGHSHEEH